ncbi:hypothetical protein AB4090_00450 [Acidithiobacillus sp. IBUN Pt1247-S3]|uniref:hypothetical protein n=1 Tax=Acidithiobacillus sp. IBUN Pt1247-S3 TaxID=3166642 RepID=UPI0034E3AE42
MTAAHRYATYEDLLDLPENVVGEIIAGELHTHPRPAPAHAQASSSLGADLGQPFGRGRGGPGISVAGWKALRPPPNHTWPCRLARRHRPFWMALLLASAGA